MPFITQGKTNWKSLLIIVIFAVVTSGWILCYSNRLNMSTIQTPIIEKPIIEKKEEYKILDKISFWAESSVKKYEIGTAEFKIYPPNKESYQFGYFEAYNKGEKIFSSKPLYQISELLSFEYKNNRYIIISDYSGGAHCCFLEYLFNLDENNNLKLIKSIPAGNTHISEDSLILKDGKLYLVHRDDRFSYFHTCFLGSYFFNRYFLLNKDNLVESNLDFEQEYIKEAENCERDLDRKLEEKTIKYFENWFPSLVCRTVNYLIIGKENKAWSNFNEYFNKLSVIAPPEKYEGTAEIIKKEIIDKMKEFIVADKRTYKNEKEVYTNSLYSYSVSIPESWKGKYFVEEKDNITSFWFYPHLTSAIKYPIFSIVVYPRNDWEQLKQELGYHGTEITSKDGLVFVYTVSLDNPFTGNEQDEYQKMAEEVNDIIKTFEIK